MVSIKNYLLEKIQCIWSFIFHNSSSSPLQIPLHPIPNPYPRQFKTSRWPDYLDKKLGEGTDSVEIENFASMVEPNEQATPLHAAVYRNDLIAIFRLLAHMDVNVEDYRGQTPAYWAAYHGHLQALIILKNFGANLEHIDRRGKNPLRAAVKYGHTEIIDFLISQNVDLNLTDGRGLTPLQLAAYLGNSKVYERLLFYGADEDILNQQARTPKDILIQVFREKYNHLFFLAKLFSSPVPYLSLQPYNISKLSQKINISDDFKT